MRFASRLGETSHELLLTLSLSDMPDEVSRYDCALSEGEKSRKTQTTASGASKQSNHDAEGQHDSSCQMQTLLAYELPFRIFGLFFSALGVGLRAKVWVQSLAHLTLRRNRTSHSAGSNAEAFCIWSPYASQSYFCSRAWEASRRKSYFSQAAS